MTPTAPCQALTSAGKRRQWVASEDVRVGDLLPGLGRVVRIDAYTGPLAELRGGRVAHTDRLGGMTLEPRGLVEIAPRPEADGGSVAVPVDDEGEVPCPRCTGDGGEPLPVYRDDALLGAGVDDECGHCSGTRRVHAHCDACERDAVRRGIGDSRHSATLDEGELAVLTNDGRVLCGACEATRAQEGRTWT